MTRYFVCNKNKPDIAHYKLFSNNSYRKTVCRNKIGCRNSMTSNALGETTLLICTLLAMTWIGGQSWALARVGSHGVIGQPAWRMITHLSLTWNL